MGSCRYYFSKRDEMLMIIHKLESLDGTLHGSRSVRRHAFAIETRRTVTAPCRSDQPFVRHASPKIC